MGKDPSQILCLHSTAEENSLNGIQTCEFRSRVTQDQYQNLITIYYFFL